MNQKHITTACFLGFLAIVSIGSIFKPQEAFSQSENRYLQKKPEFTIEGLLDGSYGTKYEAYLGDQFPLRDSWIGVKVLAERLQGKKDVNGVYFGKDDYLIEKFDREEIEGEVLTRNLERLETFSKWAMETLGEERVRVMMVPSASEVLKEKLPLLATPYDQSLVTDEVAGRLGDSVVVPIEETLKAHGDESIYYKTDHHWTALGAYYAYEAWARSLKLEPWKASEFDIRTISEDFLGTIYSKVNVPHKPDSIQLYLPKIPIAYEVYYDGSDMPSKMYSEKALKGKDKYSVYMDGNHGLTEVRNPQAAGERKLLIIKDSFAHSFAPLAINHFSETYMIDLRYFNQNPGQFMKEKGITDLLVLYQIPGFSTEESISKLHLPKK